MRFCRLKSLRPLEAAMRYGLRYTMTSFRFPPGRPPGSLELHQNTLGISETTSDGRSFLVFYNRSGWTPDGTDLMQLSKYHKLFDTSEAHHSYPL